MGPEIMPAIVPPTVALIMPAYVSGMPIASELWKRDSGLT
jgi:hypothetical protein